MAHVIESAKMVKEQEKVCECSQCKSLVAFANREVFLDIGYGKANYAEESVRCPKCYNIIHLGTLQSTEHM